MFYMKNGHEGKSKIEEKIAEAVEKTVERMPLPESKKEELMAKAEQLELQMQQKYFELTGQKSEFEPEELYRQMIREMMMKVKWIDKDGMEELRQVYKKEGRIGDLTEINEKHFKAGSGKKKFDEDAEDFEKVAMTFIKYAEGGLISPQYFLKHLFSHLESEALRKKRAELEIEPQKNLLYFDEEKDKEEMKKEEAEHRTFLQIAESRRNQYVTVKKQQQEKGMDDLGTFGKGERALLRQFKSDPVISSDMNKAISKGNEMYDKNEELIDVRAGKTIRQAELAGLHSPHSVHF